MVKCSQLTENKMRETLTPQQHKYLSLYADPSSPTFSNSYQSAKSAGYSDLTARNLTHLNPKWLSESLDKFSSISPEQITEVLTAIIYSNSEPTIIKLRALELMMKNHNMLKQHQETTNQSVTFNINLSN